MNKIEQIAKTAHEVNKAWCEFNGDLSQSSWDDAPDWQKDSARSGVIFHLNNKDESHPEATHEDWLKNKKKDGWVCGEVKDAIAKTHPCIVEYNELPDVQKVKDILFVAVVHSSELFKNVADNVTFSEL